MVYGTSSPSPPAFQRAGRGRAETALAAIEFHVKNVRILSIRVHLHDHVGPRQQALACAGHERKLTDSGMATAGGRLHINLVTRVAHL